MISWTISWVD